MSLTPSDVHNVAFGKPPIGKRGYNEDEVDAFLDLVGTELARLINENNDLHARNDQLNQRLRTAPASTAGNLRPPVPAGEQTGLALRHAQSTKVLGMAQEIADRLTGDARTEADRMLQDARTATQQLLSDARVKADSMINEARSQAQAMLEDARARAETLDRQSREKATALEREAARKHTEALGGISQEKDVLEKTIIELRAFEREYRARLKTFLNSQLRELDSPAAIEPAEETRHQHDEPGAAVLLRDAG